VTVKVHQRLVGREHHNTEFVCDLLGTHVSQFITDERWTRVTTHEEWVGLLWGNEQRSTCTRLPSNVRQDYLWIQYNTIIQSLCCQLQMAGAFSYACSLPVTWQIWQLRHSICHTWKANAAHKHHGSMFDRTGVIVDQFYIAAIGIFDLFCSCDLDPDRWPSSTNSSHRPEIYRMCKYEGPTSRLLKVIIWQTYNTYRQTDRQKQNYIPRRFAGDQQSSHVCGMQRQWMSATSVTDINWYVHTYDVIVVFCS